jgi:hypothetical protein
MARLIALCLVAVQLAACASAPPGCRPDPAASDAVFAVSQSWHVALALPTEALAGKLAIFRDTFPGARFFVFGFGKRTFMTAPPDSIGEYLIGPLPGSGVILATGLTATPFEAFPDSEVVELRLPPGGTQRLSDFIWNDLAKDSAGHPRLLMPAKDGLFYTANSRYDFFHTCNTWAIDGLAAAGLPVSGSGVVLSGQAMNQIDDVARAQCAPSPAAYRQGG